MKDKKILTKFVTDRQPPQMFMVPSTSTSNIFTVTQEMAHMPHNGRNACMLGLLALASVNQTRYETINGIPKWFTFL